MRITKRSIYAGLAGVGMLAGAGGIAAAAANTDTTSPSSTVVEQDDHDGPDVSPDYTSSVQTAPDAETEASDAAEDPAEAEEDAALAALATVTPEEASAAAIASQPGTVDDVELSNENGNVVYEVEVVDASGAEFEVIIDAGDASVLATHGEDDPELPVEYTSSIQTEPSADDRAEAALAALATVTPEEASAAALAAQPGTVHDIDLENEAGNVVYEVEVVDASGAEFEVIIDAGNAEVLATQAD